MASPAAGARAAAPAAVPDAGQVTSGQPRHGRSRRYRDIPASARASLAALPRLIGRHWIASVLIAAGLVLRVLVWMAYHPAIIYIDSLKYLYGQWPGSDPIGYDIPLRSILLVGDLGTVTAVQHLLGLAIAVTIYAVLIRRGAPRWLGALAIAPVLLDAYQLQAEAMIMPDVWFEAMIVAGIAILVWKPAPTLRMIIAAGLILGASVGVRQIGEILIVPGLLFVLAARGGSRQVLIKCVAMAAAFGLAVLLYMSASLQLTGHFRISVSSVSLTYGRMSAVAGGHCASLKIPAVERPLCPTAAQVRRGPDWLEHADNSPYRLFAQYAPDKSTLVSHFNRSVELQQPLRLLTAIGRDATKLFGPRVTSPGDTPISRWQFTRRFPSYFPFIRVVNGNIYVALQPYLAGEHRRVELLHPADGGRAQYSWQLGSFLRGYQLDGGYTPGPLYLLFTIAGLAGSLLVIGRRKTAGSPRGQLALCCLAFFGTGVAVLLMSDFFEFTWRYQLPALVTLPPAGALGIAAVIAFVRQRRGGGQAGSQADRTPELAAPAG